MTRLLFRIIASKTGVHSFLRDPSVVGVFGAKFGDCASRSFLAIAVLGLCSFSPTSKSETVSAGTQESTAESPAPAAGTPPASDRLSDFRAITSSCIQASLDAAAREIAKVP